MRKTVTKDVLRNSLVTVFILNKLQDKVREILF